MKFSSLALVSAAAAILMSLSACERSEPTAVNLESSPQPKSESQNGSWVGEGREMTQEEVDRMLAMRKNSPAIALPTPSASPAPLAKTAAGTCIMDFNSQASLAALPEHGASTVITLYRQSCYNDPNVFLRATPYNLNHFHLTWDAGLECLAGGLNWGTPNSAGACVNNVKDAMYWPRKALNMNTSTAISINAEANGYYKKFNFVAFYVRSGTVRFSTYNSGTWRQYSNCTAGQRWYMGSTTTVDQVIFFDNNNNGTFAIDNVEGQILY